MSKMPAAPPRTDIRVIPMPAIAPPGSVAWAIANPLLPILLLVVGAIVVGYFFFSVPISYVSTLLIMIVIWLFCMMWALLRTLRYRSAWRRLAAGLAEDDPNRAMMEGIDATGLTGPQSVMSPLQIVVTGLEQRLAASGLPVPRTVIPESMREELLAIPLPTDLLEPERVGSSGRPARLAVALTVLGLAGLCITSLMAGRWIRAGVYALLLGADLWYSTGLTRFTRPYRNENYLPTSWPGGISDILGRHWTVYDSVMIVGRRKRGGNVTVDILGAKMKYRFAFRSLREPDFVTLWQRWNHPHPRPELIWSD